MQRSIVVATLAGLFLIGLLVAQQGLVGVGQAVASAGWAILLVVLIHALQTIFSGMAWQVLLSHRPIPSVLNFIRFRFIREAVSNLLPMTQIGGEFISIRLLVLKKVSGGLASASVVVDLSMEVITQFVFTLLGLAILLIGGQSSEAIHWALAGVIVMAPAVIAFLLAQRYGLFRGIERLCEFIAERTNLLDANAAAGLHDEIQALYKNPRLLVGAFNLHLLSWLLGSIEVWVILWAIGVPVSLAEAMVIESLGQAVRSAAFIVPGGYGVQEGGYMLIGTFFGLPTETGLALSLVKRVREVILGLPGLLDWQILEGKRLWRGRQAPLGPENGE